MNNKDRKNSDKTISHVKTTQILEKQYLRDWISKQSGIYICRDDLYKHYEQNTSPSEVHMPHYEHTHKEIKQIQTQYYKKHQKAKHQIITLH